MVIHVLDSAGGADTQEQGAIVRSQLLSALAGDRLVIISFDGIDNATSSFVNVCFVPLLEKYSFSDIKSRVRVVKSNRQINDMIRARLTKQASVIAA